MKALSIKQPWAWLIANGHKNIENRDWPTNFRGRFLIHASKTMTKADYHACVLFLMGLPNRNWFLPSFFELKPQCGGIVGEARLVACVTDTSSPWFTGPFGFVIEEAVTFPFQPCKGMLGFFTPQPTTPQLTTFP